MARPLRIEYPGAWYHVCNRGASRNPIFLGQADKQRFYSLLAEIHSLFGVETHAYCLLSDQYHLLIHTPQAELSRAMRHLNGLYTQRFNRMHQRDGALFRGRYRAILVDPARYIAPLTRYIHLQPVAQNHVTEPLQCKDSSYAAYIGKQNPPSWLMTRSILSLFGQQHAQEKYQEFVDRGIDDDLLTFYSKGRIPPFLGDAGFRQTLQEKWQGASDEQEISGATFLQHRPSIEQILHATAQHFKVAIEDLQRSVRGQHNFPRVIAMLLCRKHFGHRLTDIASGVTGTSYSGVSACIKRFETVSMQAKDWTSDITAIRAALN